MRQADFSFASRAGKFGGSSHADDVARACVPLNKKYTAAKPTLLSCLLDDNSQQQESGSFSRPNTCSQPPPLTTRAGGLQLPITPGASGRNQQLSQQPMTPQMGGNIAYHRRQPIRECPDETVCADRYGVCIRKTNFRVSQEDRVSEAT